MKNASYALLSGMMALAIPEIVSADEIVCPPSLGNATIDGNVAVVAPCQLIGTRVKGNVHIYTGGSLVARNADIEGNIQTDDDGVDYVDVDQSRIGGSVQLKDMRGDLSIIRRSDIGGSIQLKSNRSRIEVRNNRVDADVQAFENNGLIVITENTVDGNLQCKENRPAPVGGSNVVRGNKEDQCANLPPEPDNGGNVATASSGVTAANSGGGLGSFGPWMLLSLLLLLSFRAIRRIN